MTKVKSLQQRLVLFLLLPVAMLLFGMGVVGFIYVRNSLLTQWREAAILKLQRAAHDVDMRLSRPKELLELYNETGGEHYSEQIQEWILDQLRNLEGVARVDLTLAEERLGRDTNPHRGNGMGRMPRGGGMSQQDRGIMRFHRGRIAELTPPRYDSLVEHETVSLISELIDASGRTIGSLEVAVRFDYLLQNVVASGWWQSHQAYLVDDTGKVLTSTAPDSHVELGYHNDPLELTTLKTIQEKQLGTLVGRRHSSTEVSGFYRLQEAPWNLVMFAPSSEILAPILRFRTYYLVIGSFCILFVLLLIRMVTGRIVSSIKDVSRAAADIARGHFGPLPLARSQDEVGQLISNFNTMVSQLQERIRLKEELSLAMEVQQSLLPRKPPQIEGLDIAAKSIYCDETGGDYYDFLEFSEWGNRRLGVAVGDVAGHGIAPALIMTTVRALLRSRARQTGSLSQIMTDVNRLLYIDTSETGIFMTLFFMSIDLEKKEIWWVRAGHEPAIVYDPSKDSFDELHGDGIALGVDDAWSFEEYRFEGWRDGQIILIGTDGIWETENPQSEMFGKQRLREIIREHGHRSCQEILQVITSALASHRQTAPQKDDITMVVVKNV